MKDKRITIRLGKSQYRKLSYYHHQHRGSSYSSIIRALLMEVDSSYYLKLRKRYHQIRIDLSRLETEINTNTTARIITMENLRKIGMLVVKNEEHLPRQVANSIMKALFKIETNISRLIKSELIEMNKIDNEENQFFKRN